MSIRSTYSPLMYPMQQTSSKPIFSPIRWIGGKYQLLKTILPLLPEHQTYVEPFGGGAAVLLNKAPVKNEIYNDLNGDLVNFWRVVRDPEKFKAFEQAVLLTPYSREEHHLCKAHLKNERCEIERARCFFLIARSSFSGIFGKAFSFSLKSGKNAANSYLASIKRLPQIHERFLGVCIEHLDAERVMERYDTRETLFYCDPPYVHSSRVSPELYTLEMDNAAHQSLIEQLLTLQGKVILSGYESDLYAPLESQGWHKVQCEIACRANAQKDSTRTECVWISPSAQN